MTDKHDELVVTLQRLQDLLDALQPDDQNGIVEVGALLEEVSGAVRSRRLTGLLSASLEGLQALYQGTVSDPMGLVAAVRRLPAFLRGELVAGAVVPCDLCSDAVEANLRRLVEGRPPITLDDVVSQSIQLDPDSEDDWNQLEIQLYTLCCDEALAHLHAALEKAAGAARAARKAAPDARDAGLADLNRALEAVLRESEGMPPGTSLFAPTARRPAVPLPGAEAPRGGGPFAPSPAPPPEPPRAHVAERTAPPSPPTAFEDSWPSETAWSPEPATPSRGAILAGDLSALESEVLLPLDSESREIPTEERPIPTSASVPPDADLVLMADFIAESRDYIEQAEGSLLALEVSPDDMDAVNTVFRAFHTIKGTAGFLCLPHISELAHRAESLLSRVRSREIRYGGGCADLCLRSIDLLKVLLQGLQDALGGEQPELPAGYAELLMSLSEAERADPGDLERDGSAIPQLRIGDILVATNKMSREEADAVAHSAGRGPVGVAFLRSETVSVSDVASALRIQQATKGTGAVSDASVRVRTDRLDQLIDMVGELVIAQSMIAQDKTLLSGEHVDLVRKVSHTGKIVRELQDLTMSMRMVPLKGTFQKMARLVRDLAVRIGKSVHFIGEGEETEIDRHMVNAIGDPLVHMVRNAIDHGLEAPDERRAAGKPPEGTICLRAFHAGGNVVIELQDDGKGLDRDRILKRAIARGLIDPDKPCSDADAYNLIFAPGFSTAENVTDLSGRGVGMDVVRRNVEALRGRVEIASNPGRGCTFRLSLPLTLAITDGMLVQIGAERYIVPTCTIQMSFRPEPASLSSVCGRGEMVMLRGSLMPLVRLHRLFDIPGAVEDPVKGLLVIVGEGGRRCAVLVDELLGQQQVVAKSLGEALGKVPGISGCAILGDGRVGIILDVNALIDMARQRAGQQEESASANDSAA